MLEPVAGQRVGTRTGKICVIASVIAACCLAYLVSSGSLVGISALLLAFAVLGFAVVAALRGLGIGLDNALFGRLASRPWRGGREVLRLALRHFPDVFITSPNGALLAPSAVELGMNPADVQSLAEIIEISIVNTFATEAYAAEVAAFSAQTVPDRPVQVRVAADSKVPA